MVKNKFLRFCLFLGFLNFPMASAFAKLYIEKDLSELSQQISIIRIVEETESNSKKIRFEKRYEESRNVYAKALKISSRLYIVDRAAGTGGWFPPAFDIIHVGENDTTVFEGSGLICNKSGSETVHKYLVNEEMSINDQFFFESVSIGCGTFHKVTSQAKCLVKLDFQSKLASSRLVNFNMNSIGWGSNASVYASETKCTSPLERKESSVVGLDFCKRTEKSRIEHDEICEYRVVSANFVSENCSKKICGRDNEGKLECQMKVGKFYGDGDILPIFQNSSGDFPDADLPKKNSLTDISKFASAIFRGDLEQIKAHLNAGLSPNQSIDSGLPALAFAISNNQIEAMKLLLETGANPNAKLSRQYFGRSIFEFAKAQSKNNPEILQILKSYGAE